MATQREREVVGSADLKYGDQIIEDIQIAYITETKEYKGQTTVKYYYTTQPVSELDIKPTDIRLYPRRGMNEDFDTVIKPLFEGEEVLAKGLEYSKYSKKEGTYNAYLSFYTDVAPETKSGKKLPFLGKLDGENETIRRKKEQGKKSDKQPSKA